MYIDHDKKFRAYIKNYGNNVSSFCEVITKIITQLLITI